MELTLTVLLLGTVAVGSLLAHGREGMPIQARMTWMTVGLVLIVAWWVPNPWLGALLALIALNIYKHYKPSNYISTYLYPCATFAAVYGVAVHGLTQAAIAPLLWGMVLIGCCVGLWACYSLKWASFGKGYAHQQALPGGFVFRIWETDLRVECGQYNPIHTQCLSALCMAAAIGLGLLGSVVAWCLLPLLFMPMLAVQLNQPPKGHPAYRGASVTQGPIHLLCMGLAIMPLLWGVYGLVAAMLCVVAGLFAFHHHDNGRIAVWTVILKKYWIQQPWPIRILGCGTGAWVHLHLDWIEGEAQRTGVKPKDLFTSAHNEYVQQLAEHGIVGLALLLGYVGTSLYALAHAGTAGIAVYLVGAVLASICFLHFPTDLYHEALYFTQHQTVEGQVVNVPDYKRCHGSPTLQMFIMVVLVLIELAR